jgi:hypothetical protein
MKVSPVRFAAVLGLSLAGLAGGGCSRAPLPVAGPTAFCEWCQSEKFGIKPRQNPQEVMIKSSVKNATAGSIGLANYRAWTSCKTDEEASEFLKSTLTDLRGIAEAKGVALQDTKDAPKLLGTGVVQRYKSGLIDGTLEATFEPGLLGDEKTGENGRPNEGYWINLKLAEVVRGK